MEYSPNNTILGGYKLNQKYKDIYQKSIQNREEFWKISLKTFFGTKNLQKF